MSIECRSYEIYKCDRCGHSLRIEGKKTDLDSWVVLKSAKMDNGYPLVGKGTADKVHICGSCANELKEWWCEKLS